MKFRDQVVFDIGEDKFRYLHRLDTNKIKRVDIIALNKRLCEKKKTVFYTNTKIVFFSVLCLGFFAIISLNF